MSDQPRHLPVWVTERRPVEAGARQVGRLLGDLYPLADAPALPPRLRELLSRLEAACADRA